MPFDATLLGSAVIAAAVSGIVSLLAKGTDQKSRYVIQQRQIWRTQIRDFSAGIFALLVEKTASEIANQDQLKKLRLKLAVLLNPLDEEDCDILKESDPQKFQLRIQLLLKHDWERVKLETKFPILQYSLVSSCGFLLFTLYHIYIHHPVKERGHVGAAELLLFVLCPIVLFEYWRIRAFIRDKNDRSRALKKAWFLQANRVPYAEAKKSHMQWDKMKNSETKL